MNMSYSAALSMQGRVLWALCLREIQGKHGKSRLGYLWQLIKTGFGVAVFWGIREAAGFASPDGMPTPVFLLCGFVPWFTFSQTVSMVMEAERTNKALLTFPQITSLDLCVSSAIVVWCTEFIVMLLYAVLLLLMGYNFTVANPMVFLLALSGIWIFAVGVGLVMAALNVYIPIIEQLVPMVMRVLFFTSGVFFAPSSLVGRFGESVMLLPTAQYIEMIRGAVRSQTMPDMVNVPYILAMTLGFFFLGLLFERYIRKVQRVE